MDVAKTLLERNSALFYFGLANLLFSLVFLLLTQFTTTQVLGVNAWYKPFKFAASIGIYAWTMAWFCAYLPASFNINQFNTAIIVLLGFEIVYIVLQAAVIGFLCVKRRKNRDRGGHFIRYFGRFYAGTGVERTPIVERRRILKIHFQNLPMAAFFGV